MLEVEGVTAGYGDVTVLRNVSLSAPAGSVVALLGPNGSGKTTLLRTISGLLRPASGRVVLDGREVTGMHTTQLARRGLCHVPEGRGIFPTLTLKDNLGVFAPKGKIRESIEKAAAAFPILGERLGQTAGSLSGGEQQMLAIVRAYISNPKVVLVDEASTGLAPIVVDHLFEFMSQVSKQGTTLVIVEQYVTRALELADTAYLLSHGRVVLTGPAGELASEEIYKRYLGVEV